MKNLKSIWLVFALLLLISGCEKAKDPAGRRNVAVIPAISDIYPGIFDSKDLSNSYIQFVISLTPGTKADKVTIEGSYKDNLERVEITSTTTFPATVRISSADAAAKLGLSLDQIANGDMFIFELLTTSAGVTTRSNSILNVSVACAFDEALTAGSYHSVSSDWGSEGNITITSDPDDPYTVYVSGLQSIEGLNEDHGPLPMHINPSTFTVTADETMIASDYFGYGASTFSGTGLYNSCDGSYVMNFDISIGTYGSQGIFRYNFARNP
jgi:hypothetical protein